VSKPFDWAKITWGRPDSRPTVLCSYCSAALEQGEDAPVPLMLFTAKGYAARFCPKCSELVASASLETRYTKEWKLPSGDGP
jgi:hypothetical protein